MGRGSRQWPFAKSAVWFTPMRLVRRGIERATLAAFSTFRRPPLTPLLPDSPVLTLVMTGAALLSFVHSGTTAIR